MRAILTIIAAMIWGSPAIAQNDAAGALADAHKADTGLQLKSETFNGWHVGVTCRPHLCHLHRRLIVTSPDGASMMIVIAPDLNSGKRAAIAMKSHQWNDASVPEIIRDQLQAFTAPP